jgi:hypothetical protein
MLAVQVRPPPLIGVQFGEPAVRLTMTGVCPLMAIAADCVFVEM